MQIHAYEHIRAAVINIEIKSQTFTIHHNVIKFERAPSSLPTVRWYTWKDKEKKKNTKIEYKIHNNNNKIKKYLNC